MASICLRIQSMNLCKQVFRLILRDTLQWHCSTHKLLQSSGCHFSPDIIHPSILRRWLVWLNWVETWCARCFSSCLDWLLPKLTQHPKTEVKARIAWIHQEKSPRSLMQKWLDWNAAIFLHIFPVVLNPQQQLFGVTPFWQFPRS